jgi:hypothetical protein
MRTEDSLCLNSTFAGCRVGVHISGHMACLEVLTWRRVIWTGEWHLNE